MSEEKKVAKDVAEIFYQYCLDGLYPYSEKPTTKMEFITFIRGVADTLERDIN